MRRLTKIGAVACVLAAFVPTGTRASDETDALWLARLCAHEVNWRGGEPNINDCGGILQVIQNRMVVWSEPEFLDALMRTSPRFFAGITDRSWARELEPGVIDDPDGWPSAWPPFRVYSDDFDLVYARSLSYVSGAEALPCRGRPRNWLSRTHPRDREVARRHVEEIGDWREVRCGRTVHAFYEHVPGR
jgi:hypothetical protein